MAAPEIDPEARPDRARAIKAGRTALGVAAVLILIAATLWLAIGGDGAKGPPVVLTPPDTADREAPSEDERGGAEIAHQDQKIYEIVSREEAARRRAELAPGEEEPMAAPSDRDETAIQDAGSIQLLPRNPDPERIDPPKMAVREPATEAAPPAPQAPAAEVSQDRGVATEPLAPLARADPEPTQAEPATPGQIAPQPIVPEPVAATPEPTTTRTFPPLPPRRPGQLAASRAQAETQPVAAAPPPTPVAAQRRSNLPPGSTYLIQMGAVRNKATAQREWRRLRQKNEDILGSLQLFIQEVNITGRGVFHRIQAGPLPDETLAELACGQLRSRKQACFVVVK